jgi:arylsulfatase A-like enzyme
MPTSTATCAGSNTCARPATTSRRWRVPITTWRNGKPAMRWAEPPEFCPKTEYGAEHFQDMFWANRTVEKIRAADPSTPHAWLFFCWAPHPPLWCPEPYYSMYDPADIELPPNIAEWYPGQPEHLIHGPGARGVHLDRDGWRRVWASYLGLVTMVDEAIGRVITALKERGFWDDALVIFTQDHGESLGAHRLYQKMTAYEESAHVPFYVKPPRSHGVAPGRRSGFTGHVDIAPTILDYAGIARQPAHQGTSLRAQIEDANAAGSDAAFIEYHGDQAREMPMRSIVSGRFKYINHFGLGVNELYDIDSDPYETTSLIDSPDHAGVRDDLHRRLAAWMRESGDFLNLDRNADFAMTDWLRYDKRKGWTEESRLTDSLARGMERSE